MTPVILIRVNCPSLQVAETIAIALVNERLAACANIEAPVMSVYRWLGRVEQAEEHVVILKTREALFEACEARIRDLHPDDVPAILAIPCLRANSGYADWLTANTQA